MAENAYGRSTLELRQLRYFVVLAEELSFRKAAERLYIAQPSLSHQIALLERTLGLRLFQRDRRRVALTDGGKALLDDARRLLAELDTVLLKAERLAGAALATLQVGLPPNVNRTTIPDIIAAFRNRHPEVTLAFQERLSRDFPLELRSGRLDVAFTWSPITDDLDDLAAEPILDEKSGLLMSANHRLASSPEIPVEALDGRPMLLFDRHLNPPIYDAYLRWLETAGVHPHLLGLGGAYTYDTLLQVLQSGDAVYPQAQTVSRALPPGVVFRPIRGPSPHFVLSALWAATNTSLHLHDFLRVARELRDGALVG